MLLTNYYGTGHSSMDNYISMVSGQAPEEDTQSDCSVANTNFGSNSTIVKSGVNAGQVASSANAAQPSGANAPNGANGCTYPTDTPTLFNQLDAAGKTWKGYAQDLGNQTGREDATCGGPGTAANNPTTNPTYLSATAAHPLPAGVTSFTGAQANDQYVAKHFPFPWFESLTGTVTSTGTTPALTTPAQGGTDCDAAHIANLDSSSNGLFHDLQKESTTPAFSWITPEQLQRRSRRHLQGQQPLGFVHRGRRADLPGGNAEPGVDHPEELHGRPLRLRPVPRVLHPDDREVGGVQGRRPDRHHVRRGQPAVHLLGQQLQQRERVRSDAGRPAQCVGGNRGGCGGRDDLRQDRAHRADRPELDPAGRLGGQPALPRSR